MKAKNLVCAIYNHPEAYPPTLNAIEQLSKIYDNVYLLYLPNLIDLWEYPPNVTLIANGNGLMTAKEQAQLSLLKKILIFFSFTFSLIKLKIKYKPHTVLLYDVIPLFAYFLISKVTAKPKVVWYHNHDITAKDEGRRYSIGWIAVRFESVMFPKLNIFTLPTDVRQAYFDMASLRGKYFCVPNYPSLAFYQKFRKQPSSGKAIKFIYQGTISKGHGIEEIISFIAIGDNKAHYNLTLVGKVNEAYQQGLLELIRRLGVDEEVRLLPPVNYAQLPDITVNHDIGLAIHIPDNINFATAGTASNKIYEYAAVGLPVLYFDTEHYNEVLSKYKWTFATDLSINSIQNQIDYIRLNLNQLSTFALADFNKNLNFESVFSPLINYLNSI